MNSPESIAAKSPTTGSSATPEITVVQTVESEARRSTIVALGIIILVGIGIATYLGVRQALRDLRVQGLAALRDAKVNTLEVWIGTRVSSAERWAAIADLREATVRLVDQGEGNEAKARAACLSPDAARIEQELRPALHPRGFSGFNIVDRNGMILAANNTEECGLRVNPTPFLGRLDHAFAGHPQFIRPHLTQERLPRAPERRLAEPLVRVEVPVRDRGGRVVAVLSFAEPARAQFASLFSPPGLGETDEAIAVSEDGTLLSELRYPAKARQAHILRDASLARTMLNVEVRDPGGDLLAGAIPSPVANDLPLTRLASAAMAAQRKLQSAEQRGVFADPYRNYLGTQVIGAWRWLPDHQVAVAVEIERDEAYAPLRTLDRAFAVLSGLSVAAGVGVLISVLSALRDRRRFGTIRKLGRYALIERIDQGGMATVYRGRHELLKRPIAIKILKRHASDEFVARFEREVQLASRLGHPNTVEIYDYGRTRDGDFYYVMEYLDGITLARLVEREGALPFGRVIHLLRQTLSALKVAHEMHLVHRDIKPENIMVCIRGGEYDVVKILDFGLVKSLNDEASRDITKSVLNILGTPAYMSPERFRNPGTADPRADLYAVGAVAYLLLTGKRLFEGASGEDLQHQILHVEPPSPSAVRGSRIPPALERIVAECLAKDPDARPRSAEEVIEQLRTLALDQPWSHREAQAWWANRRPEPVVKAQ